MEGLSRKRIRESSRNGSEETDVGVEGRSSERLTYDVLRMIFQYLNGMDLSSASMVCRSWLEAANNEKRTRGPVCSVHAHEELLDDQTCNVEYLKTRIVKDLSIKPELCLFFMSPYFRIDKPDCHCRVLPSNCNTVRLGTYGIVFNNKEIEETTANILYAFLPEIPDVKIRTFVLRANLFMKNDVLKFGKQYGEEFKEALGSPDENHGGSRCLLWFCNLHGRSLAIKMLNSLKRRYPGDVLSVWGGVASDLVVCTTKDNKRDLCRKYALCVGIVLTGSIDTWSIIVDFTYNTKEKVQQRLESLRKRVRLKKHSMGFMFACCARGQDMFGEPNVESSIFKTLFPDVPLIGCFGDGEFGENTIPNESPNEKRKCYNEKSTVFMILTYG